MQSIFVQPNWLGYTTGMDKDIAALMADDEECKFWPDLFELDVDDNHYVKITVHDLGDPEADPNELKESERKAREYVSAEEERIAKMQSYDNPLDRAAMALTFDQLKMFTAHYAQYSNALRAAQYADGSLVAFKRRRKIDAVFADMWELAREYWIDRLESMGMERATADVRDPKDFGPSNDMLKFMLKANSERHQDVIKVKHEGAGTTVMNMDNLDEADQRNLRVLGRKLLQKGAA